MPDGNQGQLPSVELTEAVSPATATGAASATEKVQATTLHDLMKLVLTDDKLSSKEKKALLDELRKNNAYSSDRWTYRYAILIFGLTIIITLIALWVLSYLGKDTPEGLIALGSAASGGLAGLLTPSRSSEGNPS